MLSGLHRVHLILMALRILRWAPPALLLHYAMQALTVFFFGGGVCATAQLT